MALGSNKLDLYGEVVAVLKNTDISGAGGAGFH